MSSKPKKSEGMELTPSEKRLNYFISKEKLARLIIKEQQMENKKWTYFWAGWCCCAVVALAAIYLILTQIK